MTINSYSLRSSLEYPMISLLNILNTIGMDSLCSLTGYYTRQAHRSEIMAHRIVINMASFAAVK